MGDILPRFPDLIATHGVEECDSVNTLEFAIIRIFSSPCIERARQIITS